MLESGQAPVQLRPACKLSSKILSCFRQGLVVLQKISDMPHAGKLSRREVLRDQARWSASKVAGGASPDFHVVLGKQEKPT